MKPLRFSFFASVASLMLLALPSVSPASNQFEYNTDRPGSDISSFNLSSADANQCQKACRDNPRCKAWTYVKPNTIQGPKPRCWLKNAVPKGRSNSCCISGVKSKTPQGGGGRIEINIDRPGSDFSNFNLPRADANLCQKACRDNSRCKAWTYVKPNTIQGPKPRCWLKHAVPKPRNNSCCISGVMAQTSPPAIGSSVENNVDRPGSDFSNFDLPRRDAHLCKKSCVDNPRCKAWTYVKPNTIQGPNPRCWLKDSVPPARAKNCCISGVKGR